MTAKHLKAMEEGRKAAQRRRDREAVSAVKAFDRYLKASRRKPDGTWPRVPMPRIPRDTEWQYARERGVVS